VTALRPYPQYKRTGIDWLPDVPSHWSIEPLGKHFSQRNSTVSDADYPALSVTRAGIVPQLDNVAKTDNGESRKLVKAGDFAINSRSDRKGSSGIADRDGSVSVITTVITPRAMDGEFVHQLLRSEPFQEEYYRYGSGIVADLWSTRWPAMKDIRLAVPPMDEQRDIARFLDRETAEIDAFIADQEELIGLLAERRAATISHAVTKGLDPTVPTKPGNIESLDRIPESWKVWPLTRVAPQRVD
jgi:type I restriction enzyme S subunit